MANEDSIVYHAFGAWRDEVGDYRCECFYRERPGGSFEICVNQDGKVVELLELSAADVKAQSVHERANELRPKYQARYQDEISKRQPDPGR